MCNDIIANSIIEVLSNKDIAIFKGQKLKLAFKLEGIKKKKDAISIIVPKGTWVTISKIVKHDNGSTTFFLSSLDGTNLKYTLPRNKKMPHKIKK